jgi:3D (Asp-Asp-Asp) domain-containing protein
MYVAMYLFYGKDVFNNPNKKVNIAEQIKQKRSDSRNKETRNRIPIEEEMDIEIHVRLHYDTKYGGFQVTTIPDVRVTAYNNLPNQTNDQPNIGASNRKVFEGSIALSRDILRDYNVRYGDVACISENGQCYIVEDTMNKRYDTKNSPAMGRRADIFMYDYEEALRVNFKTNIIIIKQL